MNRRTPAHTAPPPPAGIPIAGRSGARYPERVGTARLPARPLSACLAFPPEHPTPCAARSFSPGWLATAAIAVAALAIGVAAALAFRHNGDVTHQENGYRSGWQAAYSSQASIAG